MIFSFWDKINKEGVIATNLVSISQQTGVSYNTLNNWMVRDKRDYYENDSCVLFKTNEVHKGGQRWFNKYGIEEYNKEVKEALKLLKEKNKKS